MTGKIMSIKDHPKYEIAKSLIAQGTHSTRYIAQILGIKRQDVCAMARTVGLRGNS